MIQREIVMDARFYAGCMVVSNASGVCVPVFDSRTDELVEKAYFPTFAEARAFKDSVNSGELDCLYHFQAAEFADADAVAYGSM